MRKYSEFRPTKFDSHIEVEGQEDWLVAPCSRTRDSGVLEESNWYTMLKSIEKAAENETVNDAGDPSYVVHRFGHWGPGWFEICLVAPGTFAAAEAQDCENALADYPILDDSDHSEREQEAANLTWASCYSTAQRIDYIRDHRSQFEFHDFADLMRCVRGKYFAGYASELIDG